MADIEELQEQVKEKEIQKIFEFIDRDIATVKNEAERERLQRMRESIQQETEKSFFGSKVKIKVRVILEPIDEFEDALHIGFRGPGAWYEPSNDPIQYETIRNFKALRYSGPHYVDAITTNLTNATIRTARKIIGVGGKNRTITL